MNSYSGRRLPALANLWSPVLRHRPRFSARHLLWGMCLLLLTLAVNKGLYRPTLHRIVDVTDLCNEEPRNRARREQPMCPADPPGLVGAVPVNMTAPRTMDALARRRPELELGGIWRPHNCSSLSRVAIVLPYRNREKNLRVFMQHLHPFLQRQLIEYQVFVIEQSERGQFNRGMIKNIGFLEANRMNKFDCTIFHDIDLLPENDRNLYHCSWLPRHLCVAIDTSQYLPFADGAVFGGAVEFPNELFVKFNGYSNLYFGWGGEDDDLLHRIKSRDIKVMRFDENVARYKESVHKKGIKTEFTRELFKGRQYRMDQDGLSSLEYTVRYIKKYRLYTWVYVQIMEEKYENQAQEYVAWFRARQLEQEAAASARHILPTDQKDGANRSANHVAPEEGGDPPRDDARVVAPDSRSPGGGGQQSRRSETSGRREYYEASKEVSGDIDEDKILEEKYKI